MKAKDFKYFLSLIILFNIPLSAHCDGLDGPVVKSAVQALETENINHVLIWIQNDYEAEVKEVFEKTLYVRKLNETAKDLADRFFFETVVRVHRQGEGAPYDGLKTVGRDLGPAITSADEILNGGSYKSLINILNEAIEQGVHSSLHEMMEKKNFNPDDVNAGRDFVGSYVKFIHQVENIYNAAILNSNHAEIKTEIHKH